VITFALSLMLRSEPVLTKLAYSFEQATKFRKAPRFLAHVEG